MLVKKIVFLISLFFIKRTRKLFGELPMRFNF